MKRSDLLRAAIIAGAAGVLLHSTASASPWSPDGARLAYSYIGGPENLYLVNADGTDQTELVVRDERDFRPVWAPDGSHIVFTGVVDGVHVIMRVEPDGGNLEQITETAEAAGDPDYSPDGALLLYFTDEPLARDLYVRDLASGETVALTDTPDFNEMSPRWRPDGRLIAFVGSEADENVESDIWVIDPITRIRRNVTASPEIGEFHPEWSHSGDRLIYIRVEDGAFAVAIRDLATGEETIAAQGDGYAVLSPSFAPGDDAIVFTRTDFAEEGPDMPAIVRVSLSDGTEDTIARGLYLSQMAAAADADGNEANGEE